MEEIINTGNKRVICSGNFITLDKKENNLSFNYNKEEFKFNFSFVDEQNNTEPIVYYSPDSNKDTLMMTFHNFNNPGGTRLPILEVAESKGKKIYLQVIIYIHNEDTREINYTFYIDN